MFVCSSYSKFRWNELFIEHRVPLKSAYSKNALLCHSRILTFVYRAMFFCQQWRFRNRIIDWEHKMIIVMPTPLPRFPPSCMLHAVRYDLVIHQAALSLSLSGKCVEFLYGFIVELEYILYRRKQKARSKVSDTIVDKKSKVRSQAHGVGFCAPSSFSICHKMSTKRLPCAFKILWLLLSSVLCCRQSHHQQQ